MLTIVLIVVLVLALGGGGWGQRAGWGYVGWSPAGVVLFLLLVLWLTGYLGGRPLVRFP